MSAFTPGPWEAIGDDDRHEADTIPVKALDGTVVCEAFGWLTGERPDMTVAEAEANASLIAAAPDLYQALERLTGAMPVVAAYGEHQISDCACPFCDANAALAKARGDQ